MIPVEKQIEKTIDWMVEKVKDARAEGLVLGVSGGIDSAVCAFMIQRAFPKKSLGLILPCKSGMQDVEDAQAVVKACSLDSEIIDLSAQHDELLSNALTAISARGTALTAERQKMADANLRARLRMCTIYSFANALNYLVIGTDNAAELYTGYFTKYGDGAVDLLPLANLTKRGVRIWAKELGIPQQVIEKAPSAGLWVGQTDEEELGVGYNDIDDYLEGREIADAAKRRIESLHRMTQHKREMPPKPPPFDQ
jgi:NAD+ synthase